MGKLQRIALSAISGLVLLYAGDYAVLRVRGQTLGSVDVQIMWAVKQKNNRIDYELGDTETRPCVHALFPQMGYAPCWYLSRHKNQTITVGSIPSRFADMAQTVLSAAPRLFSARRVEGVLTRQARVPDWRRPSFPPSPWEPRFEA